MIDDYFSKYYSKLFERSKMMKENDYEMAKKISLWKKKMIRGWESIEVVSVNIPDSSKRPFKLGERFVAEITLDLNEIHSTDIGIEVIFGNKVMDEVKEIFYKNEMEIVKVEDRKVTYRTQIFITSSGVFDYSFRMYPKNPLLPHRQDFNLIRWI
jgi:hypothetical protein